MYYALWLTQPASCKLAFLRSLVFWYNFNLKLNAGPYTCDVMCDVIITLDIENEEELKDAK